MILKQPPTTDRRLNSHRVLILVDGSIYLFRAFHALPPLTNSKGIPTGAVYGMAAMIKRLISDYAPQYIALVFDAKGPTFRNQLYPEYKANRPPMPPELRIQIESTHALIEALGIPLLQVDGVEADDVLGTLAVRGREAGLKVIVFTSDKDLTQIVDASITVINPRDGKVLDQAGVEAKFGVPPEMIIDYLTLIGDSVDNIPGVDKVGPKTAVKWLRQYHSLANLIEQADTIGGKIGDNLRAAIPGIEQMRELIRIRCDVALESEPTELIQRTPDHDRLRALYAELEFKTWLAELMDPIREAEDADTASAQPQILSTPEALRAWIDGLPDSALVAFAIVTADDDVQSDYMQAEMVGLAFAAAADAAIYVPLNHNDQDAPTEPQRELLLQQLRSLLEDPKRLKVGQNLKYAISVLARYRIQLDGARDDTMLESYVLDSTATGHNLESMAPKYLGQPITAYATVVGKGVKRVASHQIALGKIAAYATERACVIWRLHQVLRAKLAADQRLQRLYEQMEAPLASVLSRIERAGVKVDAAMLAEHSLELAAQMDNLVTQAHDLAGQTFNLGSSKQTQFVLFGKLGLPVRHKTPKGAPSTAESTLQELGYTHKLPRLILAHRALSKLKSTYTDALPPCIDAATGRVHTVYHQAVASTGRLSSSHPNLQNIPIRTPEGRRIRQAFIAATGYRLLAADYSQIELRIIAHLSADPGLCRAFAEHADVHRATAAEVFGVPPDAVNDDQRRNAKAINFGLIYGMSAFGLGRRLEIDRFQAQDYIDRYFQRYPGVKQFMDATRESARECGYVETVFGRRLYVPEIRSRNATRRQYAERTAINAPMQGTAADIIKRAMLAIDAWLGEAGLDARMILQVHDELVIEVAEGDIAAVREGVVSRMISAAELKIPLEVDVGVGASWQEAH